MVACECVQSSEGVRDMLGKSGISPETYRRSGTLTRSPYGFKYL